MNKKHVFALAVIALALTTIPLREITSDEWVDLFILGRVPGTTVFLSFEFMFVAYIILGIILTRLLTDFRNDYWRFRFFKLKSRRAKAKETKKANEEVPVAAAEVQTT